MTPRFEQAILKLYNAFHNNTLNPECCIQCAVGNILDNQDYWKNLSDEHGSSRLNYVGKVNEAFGKRFNGYLPSELLRIEMEFLIGCGFKLPLNRNSSRPKATISKDMLFKGLVSTVSYLCKLDDIPNVMDCSILFNYDSQDQHLEMANS